MAALSRAASAALALLLSSACTGPVRGVIQPVGTAVAVVDLQGGKHRLALGDIGQPLRYLDGCVVEVEGPQLGRRVLVRDWSVITAEDGSAPYVGRLKRQGSNLIMEDRNSGSIVILEADPVLGLSAWIDQPVMVVGYISGPHRITVVAFRGLAAEPAADG